MFEIITAACLLLGAWVMFKSLRALAQGALSRSWPTVTGVIETLTVEKKRNSEDDEVFRQNIEYSYVVNQKTYRGTRIRFGLPRALRWSRDKQFRRGENVAVTHDPSRPEISVLQRGFSPFVLFTLGAGCLIVWLGVQMYGFASSLP